MGFLRVGGGGLVDARAVRQIAIAETLADFTANRGQRLAAQLHTVCPHIGDQAGRLRADIHAFIQLLRNLHRATGGKPELA